MKTGFQQVAEATLALVVVLTLLAAAVSLVSPSIIGAEQPTPTPEPVSLKVSAERGDDPTTASVSWSEYDGADFDYYRLVICDLGDYDRDSASCSASAFSSSFSDSSETGPVSASGLDPYTDYVVVLHLWLSGASDPLRFYWGILALERPTPTPEPTDTPTPDTSVQKSGSPGEAQRVQSAGGSTEVEGENSTTTPPGTPSKVTVKRADGTLTASWPAVDGATSYHVTYTSDGGASWSLAALNHPDASVTIKDVENSKTYIVGVRARNDGGDSGWRNSEPAGPYTPPKPTPPPAPITAPDTPSSVTVTRADGTLTASWPAVTGATSYHVTYTSDDGASWSLAALNHPDASVTIKDVENAKTYIVGVRARNDGGDSGWRNSPDAGPFTPIATTTPPISTSTPPVSTTTPGTSTPALSFGGATVADQSYTKDAAITTLTLPRASQVSDGASATVGAVTYSLSPTLPAGLSFDSSARTISGTPTAVSAQATYRYTATDGTDTVMLSFKLEVTAAEEQASAQSGLSWVTSPPTLLEWKQGVAVNVTLPAATGDPNITYRLSEGGGAKGAKLPQGITWNASSRTLSGTPTKWFATRVANYDADASNKSAPAVNIHIRVSDTAGNHAPYASIKSSGSQLIGQLWSRYGGCYGGTITYAPSSGHTKHFYDPEDDTLTYTAGSNKLVSTTINSSGYAVATLRHPVLNWYSFFYRATDPDGLYDNISLQVKHFNCTEQFGVNENLAAGTKVRTLGGGNAADGSSYTLSDGSDGDITSYFQVDSSTGEVTVKSGVTLDYETKTSHKGDFRYTVEGQSVGGKIQVNLNDIRAPTPDRPTLAQNSTNPTTALDVSWTAVNPPTGHTINDYDVRYREWTTSTWTEMPDTTNSTSTRATITGLTAGKEYEVQVRASINAEGDGHWSGSSIILYLAENTAVNGNVGGKFNVNATDYYPLRFTLGGTDGSKFKLSTDTGYKTAQSAQMQVKTGNVPDFESKSSYSLTLRAVENNLQRNILDITYSVLIIVTDVNEPPAAPAAPTVSANSATPESKLDVSWTAPTMTGKPPVTDYDVQYRLSSTSTSTSWTSHSFTGTGTSTTLTGLTSGKSYHVQVRATNDEGTSAWSDSGSAITKAGGVTRSVNENSAAGTNVGAAVTATSNPNNYTLAHALSGTDASKFEIGSGTGQITVKSGTNLDYETKTSYSVTVTVTASGGVSTASLNPNARGDYIVPVTINVTDVNEPPPKMAAPTVAVNATNPTSKLDISWTAPTNSQMSGKPAVTDYNVRYRLSTSSTSTAPWTSHSHTGTSVSATLANLTSNKSYHVQVRAVNAEGNGPWSDSGSAITKGGGVTRDVPENSAAGTNVGAAVTADSNPNNYTLTHALSGTDALKFKIASSTGQITVKSGTSLDYETQTSYSVIVTMTASGGVSTASLDPNARGDYTIPVTINVTNENEPPSFTEGNNATRSVAENTSAGSNIGATVSATDPDGVAKFNTLTYSLSGTDAASFDLDTSTGQIKTKAALDYEAKTSYSVKVEVTDGKNKSGGADTSSDDTISITINITDVNEPPVKLSAPSASANATTPTSKIDVSWTALTNSQMSGKPAVNDYDVQYRKHGDSNWTSHSFSGTGTSATLTSLTANKSYEVQVRANNDEGNGPWSDSDSAITQGGGVTRSVAENSAAGTNVGAAVTADSNPNNYTLTHTLSGTNASDFTIESSSGQIKVKSALDYETKTQYSVIVTVKAAAAGGGANAQSLNPNAPGDYTIPVTINVTDVNETPTFPGAGATTRSVAENSSAGTNVGAPVSGSDVDKDTLTYSISGMDTSSFSFSTSTGQIKVKSALDHEAKSAYKVSVTVTDGALSTTTAVDISVTDVNEPPVKLSAPSVSRDSSSPTSKLGVSWTALTNTQMAGIPPVTGYDIRYRLSTTSSATSTGWNIPSHSGTSTSATLTGLDANKSYQVQIRAKNHEGSGPWSDSGSAITKGGGLTRSIAENSPVGTSVGTPVTATSNPNNYTLSHTLSGTDASDFTIVSSSGQIKVKSALDYETKTSYSVIVTVKAAAAGVQSQTLNPNAPGDYTVPVTINVTDVNETPAFDEGDATTRSVEENTAAGENIGNPVKATDIDGDTLTYSLSGTDAASFDLDTSTGRIKTKAALDYEARNTYSVTVEVTDGETNSGQPDTSTDDTIAVTINITDANEPPTAPDAPDVTGNSTDLKTKMDVSWTPPDMTGKPPITDYDVRYRLSTSSTSTAPWTPHAMGTTTATSTTLTNLEGGRGYEVQVQAKNHEGASPWSASGKAKTEDKNIDSDFKDATTTRSIAENSAAGTNIGDPMNTHSSDNEDDTLEYRLSGTDALDFAIDSSTGQLAVKSPLNYEAKNSYSVTVEVTDNKNSENQPDSIADAEIEVDIIVTDVLEPPSKPDAPTLTRNSGAPESALDLSWSAPDMTGKPPVTGYDVRYKAKDRVTWGNSSFDETITSGTLTNLSDNTLYHAQVRAHNDEGVSAWSDLGERRTSKNNGPPTFPGSTATRSVAENSPAGTNVGAPVSATDPDGDALTYKLGGTDSSRFEIASSTGQITLKAGTNLNYEAKSSYSVNVEVSDGKDTNGNADTSTDALIWVTINVADVLEPPSKPAAPTVTLTGTDLKATWTAPDMTGKPPLTDYDVRYRAKDASAWSVWQIAGTATQTTITVQTAGIVYEVQVKAKNDEGESVWSDSGSNGVVSSAAPTPTPTATPAVASPPRRTGGGGGGGSYVRPTRTPVPTPTPTATPSPTPTPTATATPSPTPTATATPTPIPTATPTWTPVPTATPSPTPTWTPTPTATPSPAPVVAAEVALPTATATATPSPTPTWTPTATATPSPTPTATATATPSPTPTWTPVPTATPSPTPTATATATPSPTPTPAPAVAAVAASPTPTPVPVTLADGSSGWTWLGLIAGVLLGLFTLIITFRDRMRGDEEELEEGRRAVTA